MWHKAFIFHFGTERAENGVWRESIFNFQGAVGGALPYQEVSFYEVAINQIVAGYATEVQPAVGFIYLLAGDADVVQSLCGGRMAEHLLEEQELPWVVAAHDHLVVGERLTQRVGRHSVAKSEVTGDALQDVVNASPMNGLVHAGSIVGLAAEHEVAEPNAWGVLQIERDRFDNGSVDGYVTVTLMRPGVLGLLLQNGKPVTEGAIIIDDVGEPEGGEVAHTKSKIDANDEEHIVSEPLLANKKLGDTDDVLHILDGLGGVLVGKLMGDLLGCGGYETSLEFTAALLDGADVDDTCIRISEIQVDDLRHG